jgi:hypothetical protein
MRTRAMSGIKFFQDRRFIGSTCCGQEAGVAADESAGAGPSFVAWLGFLFSTGLSIYGLHVWRASRRMVRCCEALPPPEHGARAAEESDVPALTLAQLAQGCGTVTREVIEAAERQLSADLAWRITIVICLVMLCLYSFVG